MTFQWSCDGEYHTLRDEQGRCIAQFGPNTYGMAGSGYTRIVVNDPDTGKQIMTSLALRPSVEEAKKEIERALSTLGAIARAGGPPQAAANNQDLGGAASHGARLPILPLKLVVSRHELRNVDVCEVQEADGVLLATVVPTPDGSIKIVSKYAVDAFEDGPPMPHPVPGMPPVRAFTVKIDKNAGYASPV